MTTSKPYHGRDSAVAFKKPTVGARVYIVESSSGWPETYTRKASDEALIRFLSPISVEEALALFDKGMSVEAREENWEDVTKFLGAIVSQTPDLVPEVVAVAFWGQIVVHELQEGMN